MYTLIYANGIPTGFEFDAAGNFTITQAETALQDNINNARAAMRSTLSAEMDALLAAGFTCQNSIKMDASAIAMQLLKSGHDLATSTNVTTMDITDYNNNNHAGILLADVWTMLLELGANYQQLRGRKVVARKAVDSAQTAADVRAVAL